MTGTRRPPRPVVLLLPVPGGSAIHDLWAGTKLLVVFGISVLLTFYPGWVTIGMAAALVATAAWIAHIPRGALPSVPRWLWIVLGIGGVTAALAGGAPLISVAGVEFGLGGALHFLRITALSIVLLALGALVSWTTNVAEIGPAVATLGRPLRVFRIPVDEWAVALALALRAFPMLIDEFQVLYAARRLRPKRIPRSRKARRQRHARELIDLLAAAMTVTLRRADEMGDAITARGGTGQLSARPVRPRIADWVTLGVTAVAGGAAVAIELICHLT
ncbi:energy-coupling factor transporter transmembrane protein EcfT [Mycobacterium shinjukuense]|uniref:Energy-coupling factor transporter transmembrane protein EcfT n=1 Tax=Mycobacterium shinjukuense TaxID=398694 RepID=A0A7I7ML72_9MYCO|nr:CbiQ family ECF transporter T component [Mycobacterium shinjukuense]MCV6986620.1 energy-coupling factor transporter transmembrane protein EcfT [Mycobacterium shinjukuense]BBX72978.1 hypothetical protein MSHI_08840 [Mycobacterium shinjukuense]